VHGFQAAVIDVGVNLGGADIRMTQQFLQRADLGAAGHHVGGEAVTQCMRADLFTAANAGRVFLDDVPDHDPRELLASPIQKQRLFCRVASCQHRPLMSQVGFHGGDGDRIQ